MIGTAIRIARNSLSITARELCAKAGIARSYLSEIENGHRSPGFEVLQSVARACYVPLSQLCRVAECLEAKEVLPHTAVEFHRAIEHEISKVKA